MPELWKTNDKTWILSLAVLFKGTGIVCAAITCIKDSYLLNAARRPGRVSFPFHNAIIMTLSLEQAINLVSPKGALERNQKEVRPDMS